MIEIDSSYKKIDFILRGKKPKFKLIKDGSNYIYKYGAINYEIWSELIAEQLGLQVGINMAHYELAKYQNTYGVLTDYFYKDGEIIISSDNLKEAVEPIFIENNISANLKCNTIYSIIQACCMYEPSIDYKNLTDDLLKRWAFYGLIMESDKNATNIAFIRDDSGLRLSPDFDNSSMARMNENINDFLIAMRNGYDVYSLTDNIINNFNISSNDSAIFLETFKNSVTKYPQQFSNIMSYFEKLDIDKAINNVENINKIEVPWEVGSWLSIAIGRRYADMKNIFDDVIKDNHVKVKTKF